MFDNLEKLMRKDAFGLTVIEMCIREAATNKMMTASQAADQLAAQTAALAAAREALTKYGEHQSGCNSHDGMLCDCGLAAAWAEIGKGG